MEYYNQCFVEQLPEPRHIYKSHFLKPFDLIQENTSKNEQGSASKLLDGIALSVTTRVQ